MAVILKPDPSIKKNKWDLELLEHSSERCQTGILFQTDFPEPGKGTGLQVNGFCRQIFVINMYGTQIQISC